MLMLLALTAVTGSPTALPLPDPMAKYRAMTRATVACTPSADPDAITVCAHDRTTATQRLPLPAEIVRDGPRIPIGDFPQGDLARQPCPITGCTGIDLLKPVRLVAKVLDTLVTGKDLVGPP